MCLHWRKRNIFGNLILLLVKFHARSTTVEYSQTCELRPPKGPGVSGPISQVVSFARFGSKIFNTEFYTCPCTSQRYRRSAVPTWYSVFYLPYSLCNGNAGATYNFRKTKTKANKQTDNKRQSRRQGRIQQKERKQNITRVLLCVCVSFVSER